MRTIRLARVVVLALLCLGCGMPHDPDETLKRIRGGVILAGITENEPWTRLEDDRPSGIEVELLERFAQQWNAEIKWVRGSESELLDRLQRRQLDVVAGGLTDANPWSKKVGLTQPYVTVQEDKHVIAVAPGENRWLLELDRYLQGRQHDIEALVYGQEQP